MAITVTHKKVATLPDQPGAEVNKDEWNDTHNVEIGGISDVPGLEEALDDKADISDLSAYILTSQKGAANGVAELGADQKILSSQLPALAITDVFLVNSEAAQLALNVEEGDVAIRSDENKSYIHNGGTSGTMADWSLLLTPTDVVLSVNGQTGVVTLTTANISETTDKNYVTDAEKTALASIPTLAEIQTRIFIG